MGWLPLIFIPVRENSEFAIIYPYLHMYIMLHVSMHTSLYVVIHTRTIQYTQCTGGYWVQPPKCQ